MRNALRSGLIAVLVVSAYAQLPLTPEKAHIVEPLFSEASRQDGLSCEVQHFNPFLDFAFRLEGGYLLHCPLKQFEGKPNALLAFTKITPQDGSALTLADRFVIPVLPPAARSQMKWKRFYEEAEISGVFAMGEGTYRVELLVLDEQMRAFHKSWTVRAAAHGHEKHASIAMAPNTVASAMTWPAEGNQNAGQENNRLRLTVLLDAAPLQPSALKLRAWDRAFLLQSLVSLLRDSSYASVRLIAFNLEQRREIFRQNDFQRSDFPNLAAALRRLELGTISYRALEDQQGWSELLAKLVNDEETARQPSDAVIFLGPRLRVDQKVPPEMLKLEGAMPHLFYFEYFPTLGSDFPDTIHHLTLACNGTVLKLHTPAELADGIHKMQRMLKESSSRRSYSPATQLSSERTSDRQTGPHPPSSPLIPEE